MNIVDILLGFVGGGAIGGGALYALQQGKITDTIRQYEKTRSALDATESELKDKKGQLKLLDVSEARIRDIEGTYREEVAKLQRELDDSKARLAAMVKADPSEEIETAYKAQIQELQQGYSAQIEELRQTHQSQLQEILAGHQTAIENLCQTHQHQILELQQASPAFAPDQPMAEDYPPSSFAEPWDNMPTDPSFECEETSEIAEFSPQMEAFESFAGVEASIPEMGTFEDVGSMEEAAPERTAFESFADGEARIPALEFRPEKEAFEGGASAEESPPAREIFTGVAGLEESLPPEAESSLKMSDFEGVAIEDPASELESMDSFLVEEETPFTDLAAETDSHGEISASDLDFLNSLQSSEEIDSISSLEEVASGRDDLFSSEISVNDTSFFELLPTEGEQAESFPAGPFDSSIEDLFAVSPETNEPAFFDTLAEGSPRSASNGYEETRFSPANESSDLDFFSMLEESAIGSIESLPSDEDLALPLDELFSDDLFSEWGNGTAAHADRLESHQ
jgi:hypothetical protein